ncbi:MAG TPA: MFS transporter [Candidatus Dormibacteraeota bacterium]|nr:MFS transporter [Candidatus Dormibacteraeota bacterium]
MAEATPIAGAPEVVTPEARRAFWGAFLGFFVDFYDIYLPTVALTPAIIYFFPKNLPVQTVATLNLFVFAVTLIGRPIGSIIFGHFGDVIGRRRTTMVAISGFAVMTFLIALLPGYATWGYASIALLIVLRLVDGIFMGGEYTSANPLAIEAAPKRWRGMVAGFIQSAYPIAYIAISLSVLIVFLWAPAGTLNSPYVQFWWRIPFVFGAVLGALMLIYFARVPESKLWETQAKDKVKAPLLDLFRGRNFLNLAQVFLMMSGLWFAVQISISTTPTLLQTVLKQPPRGVTYGLFVANVFLAASYYLTAWLGQRFGRRPVLIITGAIVAVAGTIGYWLMLANASAKGPLVLTMAIYVVVLCLTISPWGIVTAYINERFPTRVRSSGYGIGYSLAVIIPSFASFYFLGLTKLGIPYVYTPLVLMALAGVLQVIGAWLGPETRDVDLHRVEEEQETAKAPAGEPAPAS